MATHKPVHSLMVVKAHLCELLRKSQKEADLPSITVESSHLIDTIIGLFGKTDLAIKGLSHPKKQESNDASVSLADGWTKAQRAAVAEVARSAIPLVKSTRMFLKKISTSTNTQNQLG
ncbi:hypothetical protein H4Q26_004949 [Puccinia striiformis f. sp. tritici PST-130]|uniref:Uncharacterized protein n=1 Tax=Puccinia striiformis f. sp. tritici PST-78 TaxID=1165861 RepID=A0A0L0USU8_9BASI|nr:hypothetical protein H4Q26_004949 [Puccinia striiformis f. sp. tritici PST-130]KNE90075.1 hypothetical protein PSTG_16480 [Puccinia striiformis f. sp. tritici PST-78]